jgi:hypothetical protein
MRVSIKKGRSALWDCTEGEPEAQVQEAEPREVPVAKRHFFLREHGSGKETTQREQMVGRITFLSPGWSR